MPSATVTVPAGAASLPIAGVFPSSYQIALTPYWNANGPFVDPLTKSAAGFTVLFPSPPFADSLLDYTVTPAGSTPAVGGLTLSEYVDELRDVLHDQTDVYWSLAKKIKYINKAIQHRDLEMGANRVVQSLTLEIGRAEYDFSELPNPAVFDVVSINLIYIAQRVVLDRMSWSDLNASLRSWTGFREIPRAFARYGSTGVYFGPQPAMAYPTEWDTCLVTAPLVALGDVDSQPYPYVLPVAYYAAYLGKLNERQYQEADMFKKLYAAEISSAQDSRAGFAPTNYSGVLGGGWRV